MKLSPDTGLKKLFKYFISFSGKKVPEAIWSWFFERHNNMKLQNFHVIEPIRWEPSLMEWTKMDSIFRKIT